MGREVCLLTFIVGICDTERLEREMLLHQAKVPLNPALPFLSDHLSPFPLTPPHNCLFSLSFHPHTPSLFPSHFPSLPFPSSLHPKGTVFYRLAGLVSLAPLEHTNIPSDANIHSDAYLFILKEGPSLNASESSRKRQRMTNRQRRGVKERGR